MTMRGFFDALIGMITNGEANPTLSVGMSNIDKKAIIADSKAFAKREFLTLSQELASAAMSDLVPNVAAMLDDVLPFDPSVIVAVASDIGVALPPLVETLESKLAAANQAAIAAASATYSEKITTTSPAQAGAAARNAAVKAAAVELGDVNAVAGARASSMADDAMDKIVDFAVAIAEEFAESRIVPTVTPKLAEVPEKYKTPVLARIAPACGHASVAGAGCGA